jgi:hypothetical protein
MWNYTAVGERSKSHPPDAPAVDGRDSSTTTWSKRAYRRLHPSSSKEIVDGKRLDVELTPKPSSVVWDKRVMLIRRDYVPVREVLRQDGDSSALSYADVKRVSSRLLPTRWEMV